jgi:hypothetical protein
VSVGYEGVVDLEWVVEVVEGIRAVLPFYRGEQGVRSEA